MPEGVAIFYQKQMSHHLLPHMGREWLGSMTHAFLIRDPKPMLASLGEKLGEFDLLATGLPQQVEIFDHVVRSTGRIPPVVDCCRPARRHPSRCCAHCAPRSEVEFSPRMLSWPPGPRATDGVWAKHWYERVERSTGFEPQAPARACGSSLGRLAEIEQECRPLYARLRAHRLRA